MMSRIGVLCAIVFLGSMLCRSQSFVRITDTGNPIVTDPVQAFYEGASWVDFNNDGLLDLFVSRRSLYQNTGNGNFIALPNAITFQGSSIGNSWADVDNDGDLDCFVAGGTPRGSFLYRNDGGGTFTKITAGGIGDSLGNKGWSCAWADYDNDGFVDLVISAAFGFAGITTSNRLFHNNGDGAFTRIDTTVISDGTAPYTVPSWSDYDDDGDMDLFIGSGPANGTLAPDYLYRNWLTETSSATFTRIATSPIATDSVDGQIWNWIDYDNDGDLDAYQTNYNGGIPNNLYRNNGGSYQRMTSGQVGTIASDLGVSLANLWADFDNDGDLDCFVTNEANQTNRYYKNNGNGSFTRIDTLAIVTTIGNHRGAAAGDYDNDGDIDLMITGANGSRGLYKNQLSNGNAWVNIHLEGTISNRAAIGAKVRAKAVINGSPVWQIREVSSQNSFDGMNMLNVAFGLGNASVIDSLIIDWPRGLRETFTNVDVNTRYSATEGKGLIAEGVTQPFTKVTDSNNPVVTDAFESGGGSWADFNKDGLLDLFVANGNLSNQNNSLYLNLGGGNFKKVATGSVVTDGGSSIGGTWGDFNNDGFLDLFVTNRNNFGNFLYRGTGDTTFVKVTTGSVVTDIGNSNSSSWVDVNNDGDLDLYVVNFQGNDFLYSNSGSPSFTFTRIDTTIATPGANFSIVGAWSDYNNDLYADLFIGNAGNQNDQLFKNNGSLSFTQNTITDARSTLGASWGDYDNDGDMDLFVANFLDQDNLLYNNSGAPGFNLTATSAGAVTSDGGNSVGSAWGDYDNDGDLDLFVANDGQNNFLYQNDGPPNYSFTKIHGGRIVNDGGNSFGTVWADYDNDGQLDLFVANRLNQQNFLYHNSGNSNGWLEIRCAGTMSNRSGIGARVHVKATINGVQRWQMRDVAAQSGYNSQNLRLHLGLGDAFQVDSIIVEWPSGIVDRYANVAMNQILTIRESANVQVVVASGWNLMSVPLVGSSSSADSLFPGSLTHAFRFIDSTGYIVDSSLALGRGFWLKFGSADTFSIAGARSLSPNISVRKGWNIVGPFDYPVSATAITSIPSGIITSSFYGFNTGYVAADTLMSGKGYWVKSSQSGVVQLPQSPSNISSDKDQK